MKKNYKTIMYYGVLHPLKKLNLYDNPFLDNPGGVMGYVFFTVFQKRPEFQHNYQRDRFLDTRDVYIGASYRGSVIHMLTLVRKSGEIILYAENFNFIFNDTEAIKAAKELLSQFYKVRVKKTSKVVTYDGSEGRYGNHDRFRKIDEV